MENKTTIALSAIAATLAFCAFYFFSNILMYLAISAFLSIIGQPVYRLYEKIKFKKFKLGTSALSILTILSVVGILAGIFSWIIPMTIKQAKEISAIDPAVIIANLRPVMDVLNEFYVKFHLSGESTIEDYINTHIQTLLNQANLIYLFNSTFDIFGNIAAATFAVLFITFFFLKDKRLSGEIILLFTPLRHREKAEVVLKDSKQLLTRYFIGIVIEVALVSILILAGLKLIGIQNAILIAFFAGILNIIPYVGPIIGLLLGLLIGLAGGIQHNTIIELSPLFIKITSVFIVVQVLDNLIFQPLIYSNSVKAHPLEIFIVILMAANIFGIAGMILAVPVYTVLRVFAREFFSRFEIVNRMTKNI